MSADRQSPREGAPWLRRLNWHHVAWAVVCLALASHLLFFLLDARLPQDRNLVHRGLPDFFRTLTARGNLQPILVPLITETSELYNLFLALLMMVLGRNPIVLELVNLAWLGLLLSAMLSITRRLAGAAAAAGAVALLASAPLLIIHVRVGWVHLPETAMVVALVALHLQDPSLLRGRTAWLAALLGGLTLLLRPSGLIWVAPLIPLFLSGWRGHTPRWRFFLRVGGVLGFWLLSAIPLALEMSNYLLSKLGSRPRYSSMVPDMAAQLEHQLGLTHMALILAGVFLLAPALDRQRRAWLLLLGYLVICGVLFIVFRVGLDNFPIYLVVLCLVGGVGLATLRPWLATLPVALMVLIMVTAWLPPTAASGVVSIFPGMDPQLAFKHFNNRARVHDGLSPVHSKALLQALCPPAPRACKVAVEQGLFYPFVEDPGNLELFLLGMDRVDLLPVWAREMGSVHGDVDILVRFQCQIFIRDWAQRYPAARHDTEELSRKFDMQRVWSCEVEPGCSYSWFTPKGLIGRPDLFPHLDISGCPSSGTPSGVSSGQ